MKQQKTTVTKQLLNYYLILYLSSQNRVYDIHTFKVWILDNTPIYFIISSSHSIQVERF